jgi:uncharacterized protein YjlB
MTFYNTEINDLTINNIYTFSDIHADIHSLIIILRDCAKVIKLSNNNYNLEDLLNINIACPLNHSFYLDNLNYEWCGINSQIVIIGDIIDGARNIGSKIHTNSNKPIYIRDNEEIKTINYGLGDVPALEHEYLQIELKILLFLNAIHEQAIKYNGAIHKLLGNHEYSNIIKSNVYHYCLFKSCLNTEINYFRGYNRIEIFYPGNPGYKILFKYGCGLLLKINNNIFVHGSLQPIPLSEFININNIINNPNVTIDDYLKLDYFKTFIYYILSDRTYGYCLKNKNIIINDLQKLLSKDDITNYRVIVGHCIQSFIDNPITSLTFTKQISSDNVTKTFSGNPSTNYRYFGITCDCYYNYHNYDNYYLFRVDVGTSRCFPLDYKNPIRDIKKRTPQVLRILTNINDIDEFYIIKSRFENTIKNQPRKLLL